MHWTKITCAQSKVLRTGEPKPLVVVAGTTDVDGGHMMRKWGLEDGTVVLSDHYWGQFCTEATPRCLHLRALED